MIDSIVRTATDLSQNWARCGHPEQPDGAREGTISAQPEHDAGHDQGEEDCVARQEEHNQERREPVFRCLYLAAWAGYKCSPPAVLASHFLFAGRGKFDKLRRFAGRGTFDKLRATAHGLPIEDIRAGKPPLEMRHRQVI